MISISRVRWEYCSKSLKDIYPDNKKILKDLLVFVTRFLCNVGRLYYNNTCVKTNIITIY